ncbi:hypothetical protein QAD02_023059 [Eretmocerus hayati]|uniref:Uncharacterized protein n=1 Tax=Eretmocerus hayati TaxID=131215 RepID=A0ACC2PUK2_9HYME|nr:hypothetical protein QAD02_023059 [Eretmocerus hayati]
MIHKMRKKRSLDETDNSCNGKAASDVLSSGGENSRKKKKLKTKNPQIGSDDLKSVKDASNGTNQSPTTIGINTKSLKELKKEKKKLLKLLKDEKLTSDSKIESKSADVKASADKSLLKKLAKRNKQKNKHEKVQKNSGDSNVKLEVEEKRAKQFEGTQSLKDSNPKKYHKKKGTETNRESSTILQSTDTSKLKFSTEQLEKVSIKQESSAKANTDKNIQANVGSGQDSKKKKKKKKKKNKERKVEEGGHDEKAKPQKSNDESSKTGESKKSKEKVISTKRKEFFKKKREQFKESQKLMKLQQGPTSGSSTPTENMSLEQIKEKISELQSRETLSNTAKRKLRVLKKKAEVMQNNKKNPKGMGKIHSKVLTNLMTVETKKEESENITQEPLFIEDRQGDLSLKKAQNRKIQNKLQIAAPKENINKLINGSASKDGSTSDEEESDELGSKDYLNNVTEQMESENDEDSLSSEDVENDVQGSEDDDKSPPRSTVFPTKTPKSQSPSFISKPKEKKNETPGKKQRYVLFVGNLAYDSTTVDLKKHFLTKVDRVKDVRIPLEPGTNKPRGFAYVEVETSEDYEKGLSLHRSFLRGRPLKVEYTTSGSKASGKKKEIIHKNKKLHAMRKAGMLAGSKKKGNFKKEREDLHCGIDEIIKNADKNPVRTNTELFKSKDCYSLVNLQSKKDESISQKDQHQVILPTGPKECVNRLDQAYKSQQRVPEPHQKNTENDKRRRGPTDKSCPRRSLSNVQIFDREKKQQVENLTKEIKEAEATLGRTKKKLDAAKARIAVLESDLNASKRTVTLLNEKTTHDNQLIGVLHDKLRAAEVKFQNREFEIKKQMDKYEREIVLMKGEIEASHLLLEDLRRQMNEGEKLLENPKSGEEVLTQKNQEIVENDPPVSPKSCSGDENEYMVISMAAEAEKERLLELVMILNQRLDRERDESGRVSDLYKRERSKAAKLETKLQKIELERVGLSKANTGSYRMRAPKPIVSSNNDPGDSEEIRLKLELLEEECLTLRTRLATMQKDKDADLLTFKKMLEQTRKIFKDAYRERLPMTGRHTNVTI